MGKVFKNMFWKSIKGEQVKMLETAISDLSLSGHKSWYYYIDFGYGVSVRPELKNDPHSGLKNWNHFITKYLPDVRGKRVLDIGCNAGLYDLKMVDAGAVEVVGVDIDVRQAEFVHQWFTKRNNKDYSCIRYIAADATQYPLSEFGMFDMALIFRVAYHFGEGIHHVMSQLSQVVNTIVMQGNTPRLTNPKYANRTHQNLAGVDGMVGILQKYGYEEIRTVAPKGHPNPLVIGTK